MKKFVFAFTLVVLCAASYAQQQVLAVMPFQTHTEAVSQSEADAVTMEFSNRLSDKKIFIIVPRTDIDNAFKTEIYHQMSDWSDKDKTVEMGKVLNANWILTGSFSWVGTKITLVVTIYEVNTREQKPGGASLRGDDMDDVFDQIDDFVQEIVGKLIAHGGSFGQGDFQPIVPDGFILIKGGSFVMGSSISKAYLHDSEGPLHNVIVSEFYLGKHEVTQAEYRDVMGKNPSNFTGTEFPVESVSWFDAVDYCNRRSLKEGLTPAYTINGKNVTWNRDANGYRLPTEAEWEYACRAGTTTPFRTGDNITINDANYDGSSLHNNMTSGTYDRRKPTKVESFVPNAFGLYDMHGNVYEWCWDWYGAYSSDNQTNPKGAPSGEERVVRGGSWNAKAEFLRSTYRGYADPSDSGNDIGFRLARSLTSR